MKVFIVGDPYGWSDYHQMFTEAGWDLSLTLNEADLVQFTGGSDVNPELYNEPLHPESHIDEARDRFEAIIFHKALQLKKPMAGICRGGQFLNVMCGGSMWQHVDGHAIGGTHEAIDVITKERFRVTSTHHQMMRPGKGAITIAIAYEAKKKERMRHVNTIGVTVVDGRKGLENADVEILYYADQNCLCFQPHPEFMGHPDLTSRYFKYLKKFPFGVGAEAHYDEEGRVIPTC